MFRQALELARLRLSTDTPPAATSAPSPGLTPTGCDAGPGRQSSFSAGRDAFRIEAPALSIASGSSPAEHSDTSMSPTAPADSPRVAGRSPPPSPPGRRLYVRHAAAAGGRRATSDLDVRTASIKSAAAAGGPASLLSAALQQPRGRRLGAVPGERTQGGNAATLAQRCRADDSAAAMQPEVHQTPVGDPAAEARQQMRLVRVLLSRGKAPAALQLVESLLPVLPADPALLCLRGQCLAANGNNVGVRCL